VSEEDVEGGASEGDIEGSVSEGECSRRPGRFVPWHYAMRMRNISEESVPAFFGGLSTESSKLAVPTRRPNVICYVKNVTPGAIMTLIQTGVLNQFLIANRFDSTFVVFNKFVRPYYLVLRTGTAFSQL
jgi:hypothetical protein